jgi:hypothetical protein
MNGSRNCEYIQLRGAIMNLKENCNQNQFKWIQDNIHEDLWTIFEKKAKPILGVQWDYDLKKGIFLRKDYKGIFPSNSSTNELFLSNIVTYSIKPLKITVTSNPHTLIEKSSSLYTFNKDWPKAYVGLWKLHNDNFVLPQLQNYRYAVFTVRRML